jgi:ABC-2 type transport system ATP-binding protein
MNWIEIHQLRKYYQEKLIFELPEYTFTSDDYHFIVGENGSGKSTFFACLLKRTDYEGSIFDQGMVYAYAPEKILLPDTLTIEEFLQLLLKTRQKDYYNEKALEEMLQKFHLDKTKQLQNLSQGMKQKVVLIQCLLCMAQVYLFDEPLNGLDQDSQTIFFHELSRLKRNKKIIIIATHRKEKYPFRKKKILKIGGNHDSSS